MLWPLIALATSMGTGVIFANYFMTKLLDKVVNPIVNGIVPENRILRALTRCFWFLLGLLILILGLFAMLASILAIIALRTPTIGVLTWFLFAYRLIANFK